MNFYILQGRKPVRAKNSLEWANWFETANRVVAKNQVTDFSEVSTVFLGINHRFLGDGPPILFETMVFGGPLSGEMNRYVTWEDAEKGHLTMVERVGRGEH